MQSFVNEPQPETWTSVGPLLDEAMAQLNEKDRSAIVLRYFEGKPLKDVGAALGASEDAAKMRVGRALEKLRIFMQRRGITVRAGALAAAICENSVQSAPAGLAASVTSVAASAGPGAAAAASFLALAKGAIHIMTTTKISAVIGACVAVTVIGLEYQQISAQKQRVKDLEAQVAQSTRQAQPNPAQLVAMDLPEPNAASDKAMEEMKRSLAKARARAAAALAAKGAGAPTAADSAKGPLRRYVQGPRDAQSDAADTTRDNQNDVRTARQTAQSNSRRSGQIL